MEREEILKNELLKSCFVHDRELPITVSENPYFLQRLHLLDRQFGCINAFKTFCKDLANFKSVAEYIAYRKLLEAQVLARLNERIVESDFKTISFWEWAADEDLHLLERFDKQSTYGDQYINKTQILIRFNDSMFSPLRFFSPSIFESADTWHQYLSWFTRYEHLHMSTAFENMILSKVSGLRLYQLRATCFYRLLTHILHKMPSLYDQVVSVGEDGIVIVPKVGQIIERGELLDAISSEPSGIGNYVETEVFWLKELEGIGLMKNIYGFGGNQNRVEFKHVDPDILPQVITYYNRETMLPDHLVFKRDGRLAKFLEPIKNPFK